MKRFLLMLTLFCALFSTVMADQVTIGSLSEASENSYLPWNSYYKYGLTQQLYTPEEIGVSGSINSITLQLSNAGSAALISSNIEIYMKELDKESFASGSDWVALSQSDLVYSGTVDVSTLTSTAESVTFTLSNAFTYNGTGNLLVVFRNLTGDYKTGLRGAAFQGDDNLAIYAQRDGSSYDIATPGVSGTISTYRDVITLDMTVTGTLQICGAPTSLEASDLGARQATLNWQGGSSNTYDVEYKLASLADEDRNWTLAVQNTQLTSFTLTGLQPNTKYDARVHCVCPDGVSSWKKVSFTTAIGLPYGVDFDDLSALPTAWKRYSGVTVDDVVAGTASLPTSTTTSGWTFQSNTTVFGSKHMYVNIWSTYKYWLVLPAIPIEENVQLSFSMALSKSSTAYTEIATTGVDDKFAVVISTDNGATWQILRVWDNAGSEYVYNNIALYGEEVAIDLSLYAGQSVQLAFYGGSTTSNADNYLHIDDVLVDYIPSCLKPSNLHAVDSLTTKQSVQVAWDANTNEQNWKIQYKKKADTDWTTLDNITANPYTITGLESFTEYNVQVAAFCDPTDESTLTDYCKPIVVKTAAGVPYHEGFRTSTWPSDWKRYKAYWNDVQNGGELTAVSDGWSTKAKASANYIFPDSAYHAMLTIGGADSVIAWMVSPAIEMEAGYELSFNLALTKTDGTAVEAGGQDDDKFAVLIYANGQWNELREWSSTSSYPYDEISSSASGQVVKLDLSAYDGQMVQIAFYGESTETNGNNNLHITNVTIDLIPDCSAALSLVVPDVTASSATAVWTSEEAEGDWQYGYVANPASDFVPTDADFAYTISDKTVTLTGLNETTQYAFFVRHACEGGNSDYLMQTFTTLQVPAELPYDNNFESANGWLLINGDLDNKWFWGDAAHVGESGKALYISNDFGTSNAYTITAPAMVYATKTFNFAETGKYSFSFDWIANGEGSYDYLRVALVPAATELEASSTVISGMTTTALPAGWIALDGGSKLNLKNEWQHQALEMEVTSGTYKVVLAWRNDNSGGTMPPAAVDNFHIAIINCDKPTGLAVDNLDAEAATLIWNEEQDGSNWVYAYAEATAEEPADEAFAPIAVNSIVLNGLTYNTNYKFYLRKVCGEGNISESAVLSFKTLNPYLVVINENASSSTSYVPFNGYYADEANLCQLVIPADSLLRMEWDTITQLTFYTTASYADVEWPDAQFEVYMAEAPAATVSGLMDWNEMTLVKNAANLSVVDQEMVVTLTQPYVYQGGHLLIGFKQTVPSTGYAYAYFVAKSTTGAAYSVYGASASSGVRSYLPKIAMNIIPGDAPACAKPGNLVAIDSTATTTSIKLDWVPAGIEEYWFVQYKKSADNEWIYVADSVNAHPFVLGGLEPATDYDVRIAAWCNLEDSTASDYSAVVPFRTKCVSVTAIDENFDDIEGTTNSHVLPICWQSINTTTYSSYAYYPTVYKGAAAANTPDNYLRFYSYFYNGTTNYDPQDQYAILPEIENVSSLRMKFNARKYLASYDATFTVGIMSDPADTATFIPVATLAPADATYEPFIVPFDTYVGAGKYIAIKMKAADIVSSGSSYRSVYIDDVVVEEIPSCMEPKDLMVIDTTISINSAVFAWTVQGPETEWIFQYKKHADEEWTSVPALRADSFLLTGLEASTVYDAKVAAKCSDSDISPNTDVISFTTECEPWSITDKGDYIEGFEAYEGVGYSANGATPLCWETDGTSTYAKPHVVAKGQYAYVHDGNQSLNFCASANSYQYAALPEFAEPLNTLQISFWTQMESTSNGTLYLGYADSVANFHQLTSYESVSSMTNYESILDTVPAEAVRLVFLWNHTGSSYYSCCIDDIKVSFIPNCLKPNTVSVDSVAAHLAEISWKAGEEGQTAWQIAYDTIASNQPDTLAHVIDVADSSYVASELVAEKKYYAYVRTNCDGVYSEWTNAVSFTTLVACPAPSNLKAELTMGDGTVATLKWKAGREETAWILEYSLNADMSDSIAIEVADTIYNFEGLTPETKYYARVKADCGEIEGKSLYSEIISFKPTNALSLTINNGTATNGYVPVYGFYVDNYSMSQFIVPADSLAAAQWGTIDGLTFYASQSTIGWASAKFEVYVAEVQSTTISALADWASLEKVMNEAHLQVSNNKLEISFDAPYTYQGGNLLIGIKQTVYGSYGTSTWYGVTATGASMGGYLSKSGTTPSVSQQNFLPKMTVNYIAGQAPACLFVNNIQVSNLTATSATIAWTAEEGQSAWQIACGTSADFDPNEATLMDAASNPFVVGELTPETTYYIYVRANCGEDGFSAWSKIASFTTASTCQKPDDVQAAEITGTSAAISWNTYGQEGFALRYSTDGMNWLDTIENVSMPYALNGLTAGTTYVVQVKANCSESEWSASKSFKTAYGIPYGENFNALTALPSEWKRYDGLLSDVMEGAALTASTGGWTFQSNTTVLGSKHMYVNIWSTNKRWIVLPTVEMENNVQLTFSMALTKSTTAYTDPALTGTDDKFVVLASTDGGATWTILRQWDNAGSAYVYNNIAVRGEEVAIDLSQFAGQGVQLAFYGESTVSNADNYLHVDDILVDHIPACVKPQGLGVSNVLAHSAQLSWTAAEGQDAWDIAIDTLANFNPDALSAYIAANANPFVVTGLLPEHTYYVYVRANCAEDGFSAWSKIASFTTTVACPAPANFAAELTQGDGTVASLSWSAGEANAWTVQYSLNADFTDSIEAVVTEPALALTGLTPGAKYYARVKADCGELDGESEWSIINFTPSNEYSQTINDGTATNEYVPFYGYYADNKTRSQFIVPETALDELLWDTIHALTFYVSSPETKDFGAAEFEVYMAETQESSISSYVDWSSLNLVATTNVAIEESKMVITLSTPFYYTGGNLLFGFNQITKGGYAHTYWYGVEAQGASYSDYINNYNTPTGAGQRNFLPKMTLTYVPGEAPACPNPKYLAVTGITDSEATFTWKAYEGATWEYALVEGDATPAEFIPTTENSVVVGGLAEATSYTFYLRRACGEDYSEAMLSVAFTTEVHAVALPYYEHFEGENYWKFVNGEEPNAWVIGDAVSSDGVNALYISNDNGESHAYDTEEASATFATLLFEVAATGTYTFTYDWIAYGDFSISDDELYDYLRVGIVPAEAVVTAGAQTLPEGFIALDNGGRYGESTWQHASASLEFNEAALGQYKLLLAWFNDDADGETPAAIDNIAIVRTGGLTGIESGAGVENKAVKFILNDQVYIMLNGTVYNITGQKVELK